MANVTITTDSNHDDLTTRNAGQNITINNGAVLTVDSYPQETAMGLLGQISTNDGIWRIDGRQVKEFAYSSGSGSLPAIGDTITDSGGASGKVIFFNSGTAASGVMTVTQQSGTFTASNTLTSGGFSATLSSVKVGYLQFFMEDGNNSGKGLGSLEFLGEWYEIGTGDGTDGQVFFLPHLGTQQGIWVETGAGTGVYERWFRRDSTTAFTDYQTDELGKCYDHSINSNTVTFGTSTNGNTPPSGAKLRIPNVHIGTATLAAPTTEVAGDTAGNSMWNVGTNSSLGLTLNKVNASTLNTSFTGLDSVSITDSSISVMSSAISNITVGLTDITNSVVLGSRDFDGAEGTNISFTDLSGLTIVDSMLGSYKDFPVNFNTSSDITLTRVVLNGMDPKHQNNNRRIKFTNCAGITGTDVTGIRTEMLFEIGTSNGRFTNYRFSDGESSTLSTANAQSTFFMQSGANDIVVDGVSLIPNGSAHRNDFVEFVDAIDCIIRNAGSPTSKIDCQNQTDYVATFAGVSNNCKLQRVYLTNTRNVRAAQYTPTTINCKLTNCSSGYDRGQIPDSKDTLLQGMHGASGSLNTNQGLEIDYPLTAGVHGLDFFTSDTDGRIHALFTPPTAATAQYVTLTGGAIYNKEGDLLLRTLGDSATIEVPYSIKGHSTLVNATPTISGTATGNIDVDYSIDTGSGYGAFTAATGANLSAETISPAGFKIKFRFTANNSANNTLANGFFIETTTSLATQAANFYPFASPLMGFNLTQTGSQVAIYDNSTGDLLATGAEDGAGVTAAAVAWEADFAAVERLRVAGYAGVESLVTVVEAGSIQAGIQSTYPLIGNTDPNLTANLTITNHGASPVSWDAGNGAKDYSITIQTDATGDNFTNVQLLNEINYSVAQTATYFGFSGFDWPEMVIQAGTTIETARGRLFGSAGATLKGVRVVKSDGSTAHPALARFQADDGTYGQAPVAATANVPSIVSNSRLRVFNKTTNTQTVNTMIASTSYSATYTDGTTYSSGDLIEVRLTQVSGTTAKAEFVAQAVATSQGWSVLAAQVDDDVYNALALNGSTITKFSADYVNDEIDISVGTNFLASELYAWWVYNLTTSQGISDFFGGITAQDEANFKINNSVVNIFLDNDTATNVAQLDNRRIYRADGARPVVNPTTGGGGIDVEWRSPVTIAASEAIQSALANIYTDTQRVDGLIENVSGDRYTSKALEQAPSGGGGGGTNVNVVSVAGTSVSGPNDLKADVTGLSTFDPANDVVANVTTVQTTVANSDMRGTDGANTVAPDNAGITANGNAIAALNDFDPAADTVANVTTVQTTVTNTDMRGTDGANTVAPDNATIADIYTDTQRVDGLLENVGGDRYTSKALEEAPSGGGGGGTNVNVVSVGGTSVSGPDDLKADVDRADLVVINDNIKTSSKFKVAKEDLP